MTAYRAPMQPQAKVPPRTPWWRMLRASVDGTLLRVRDRRFRHYYGIVKDPEAWAKIKGIEPGPGWGHE